MPLHHVLASLEGEKISLSHSRIGKKELLTTTTPSSSPLTTTFSLRSLSAPDSIGPLLSVRDLRVEIPLGPIGHLTRLVRQLQRQSLEMAQLGRLEDDDTRDLVKRSVDFLVPDHLGHQRGSGR